MNITWTSEFAQKYRQSAGLPESSPHLLSHLASVSAVSVVLGEGRAVTSLDTGPLVSSQLSII